MACVYCDLGRNGNLGSKFYVCKGRRSDFIVGCYLFCLLCPLAGGEISTVVAVLGY